MDNNKVVLKRTLLIVGFWFGSAVLLAIASMVLKLETEREFRVFLGIATISVTLTMIAEPFIRRIPAKFHILVAILLLLCTLLSPLAIWLLFGKNLTLSEVYAIGMRSFLASILLIPTIPMLMLVPVALILIGVVIWAVLFSPK